MKVLNHFIGKRGSANSDTLFSAENTVSESILIDSNMTLMHATQITLDTRAHNLDRIRSLCRNAYLGGSDSLIRALGQYKMYVDTSDQGISCHLLLDGYWEIWVTEAIVSLIRPGMVVADVGANLGYFTMIMADLVGPTGRVHAFEPNPAMLRHLNRNVFVNGFASRTRVHDMALSDTDGAAVAFMIPQAFPGGGTLNHHAAIPGDGSIQVATARLDSRADWMQIELMKVDVEGAEELVWRGAKGLFDSGALRTVLLEFNAERYANPADFLASIRDAGFAMSVIHHDQGIIATSPGELVEHTAGHDVMLLLQR
jgi:FkbM family methyltransferase